MNNDTTVTIDIATASKLNKFTSQSKTTKKDFLRVTMDYLERNGINPKEHESAAREMNKLIKRIDQVVSFIKVQERDMLRPACESIFKSEVNLSESLKTILRGKDIKQLEENQNVIIQEIADLEDKVDKVLKAQEKGFEYLARLIDAKQKSNVFNDIAKAYDNP